MPACPRRAPAGVGLIRPPFPASRRLWRERIERYIGYCDFVSDEDLGLIYPGEPALEIAGRWLEAGARLVVVTRGSGGAEAFRPGQRIAVPSLPVDVVDTVGAGDSFQGGADRRRGGEGRLERGRP